MKHIFYIQTNVTKICMDSIIAMKNIDLDDVIIILFKNFESSFKNEKYLKAKVIVNKFDDKLPSDGGINGFINEWRRFFYVRKMISKEKFIVYSPVDSLNIHRHLIFRSNCVNYFLLEEGLSSYFDFSYMQFVKKTNNLKHCLLPKASQYISQFPINKYEKFGGGFGFSENSYPYLTAAKTFVIPIVFNDSINSEIDRELPIFICDGMVDNGQCDIPVLVSFLKKFFENWKTESLYIKFHVRQSDEERNEILNIFNSIDVNCVELSSETVIEQLSGDYPLELYGFYSSLLYYNKILGSGNSYSLGEVFLESLPQKQKEERKKSIFGDVVLELYRKVGVEQFEL